MHWSRQWWWLAERGTQVILNTEDLLKAEQAFLDRCSRYFDDLHKRLNVA